MEIQQSVKLTVHRTTHKKWVSHKGTKDSEKHPINTTPKLKWKKLFFHTIIPSKHHKIQNPPEEFLCPISRSIMTDPVIVSSGHSFERASVEACKNLNFTPKLSDGTLPDFTTVIPNLALKSAILKWCETNSILPPLQLSSENLVRTLIASKPQPPPQNDVVENPINSAEYSSSEESIATTSAASTPPLHLSTRPSCCYSSPSSSEIEPATIPEEEEIVAKLKNPKIEINEEALILLRKLTRTREETRVQLCTLRLLSALRSLVVSKNDVVQVNALASVVNLSLEKLNKVKIVRSGIVRPLIEVLRFGSSEAQEHASGALFSLALDDDNKTAIGVLGALSPLIHMLRSESERTRHDSSLALYHLSLVQSNRTKMVKVGSVPVLLNMVRTGHMTGRILLILVNLGSGSDGRAALLDAGAVECLVELLGRTESVAESTRASCVGVMYELSHGGLRFKAVAKAAGVVDLLQKVEMGSHKAKEKVRKILEVMKAKEVEEEEVDWEELLDLGLSCRTQNEFDESTPNSAEF